MQKEQLKLLLILLHNFSVQMDGENLVHFPQRGLKMKTLKTIRKNGRFDIVVNNGCSTVLDSNIAKERIIIAEQRLTKNILDRRNIFNPSYGLELNGLIGKKQISILELDNRINNLKIFYRNTSGYSGNLSVSDLVYDVSDDNEITCTVKLVTNETATSNLKKI